GRRVGPGSPSEVSLLGGAWSLRPERPLLEVEAAAVLVEADDPKIAIQAVRRSAVGDLCAHDAGVALDRNHLGGDREHLVRALALGLPQLGDRAEAAVMVLERRSQIGGAGREEVRERGGSGGGP